MNNTPAMFERLDRERCAVHGGIGKRMQRNQRRNQRRVISTSARRERSAESVIPDERRQQWSEKHRKNDNEFNAAVIHRARGR